MEIIVGRRGDQGFPITDRAVSGKHLKLTALPNGKVQVEDLGSTNGTFVDGVRIIQKVVDRNTVIQMGSTFTFRVSDVLPEVNTPPVRLIRQPAPGSPAGMQGSGSQIPTKPAEYSIAHLEKVWNDYDRALMEIREKAQNIGKKRMLPMMLGMASSALSPILAMILSLQTLYITVPIALICLIMYIQSYNQKDTSSDDQRVAKANYIKHYVCPNPECHRYVGNMGEYMVLKQNTNCPHCKCKWTTK